MTVTLLVRGSLRGHPQEVPIEHIVSWAGQRIGEGGAPPAEALRDRVAIVKAETGSGKSTALPGFLFRLLRPARTPKGKPYRGRSLLCTQPRVLTAMTLARDANAAPYAPDLFLPATDSLQGAGARAGTVGFQTGPITHSPPRGLVYSTLGVLQVQLRKGAARGDFSEIAERFAIILVDEAHEQSVQLDTTLMLLKRMLLEGIRKGGKAARNLPLVILASATIDVEPYARFFELVDGGGIPLEDNVFYVSGRQHGIEERWPQTGTNNYPTEAAQTALKIHLENADDPPAQRDVLVFAPGAAETKKVVTEIEKVRKRKQLDPGGPVLVLQINSEAVNTEDAAYRLVKAPL